MVAYNSVDFKRDEPIQQVAMHEQQAEQLSDRRNGTLFINTLKVHATN